MVRVGEYSVLEGDLVGEKELCVENAGSCVFCSPPAAGVFLRNGLAFALWDGFPVTPLHALIIPRRHVVYYFDMTRDEVAACDELVRVVREQVCARDAAVAGFNMGVNVGRAAGQTIFHAHIHLIPRRVGDVEEPRGGVRHIIPGRGAYCAGVCGLFRAGIRCWIAGGASICLG